MFRRFNRYTSPNLRPARTFIRNTILSQTFVPLERSIGIRFVSQTFVPAERSIGIQFLGQTFVPLEGIQRFNRYTSPRFIQ